MRTVRYTSLENDIIPIVQARCPNSAKYTSALPEKGRPQATTQNTHVFNVAAVR